MNVLQLRRLLLFSAVAVALTPSMGAAPAEEQAVLVPIDAMFSGMSKRDAEAIKASALPGATMVLMHSGTTQQITVAAFAERVGKGKTQIEERIHDPLTRIDHELAMVWAPFEFLRDGKVDHCGTDLFSLVHTDGKWLIASLAATVQKDCGAK